LAQTRRFEGYTDSAASQKKLLHNVVKSGDCYFNSGDLLSRDSEGFFYWCDRVGDTYRWHAENVSTAEVSQTLGVCKGLVDLVVYGVEVPHCDGKAGMMAVVLDGGVKESEVMKEIHEVGKKSLPPYARPLFIRIRAPGKTLPVTSTYKYLKNDFVKEVTYQIASSIMYINILLMYLYYATLGNQSKSFTR
jgi:acyl-CoA synthetase (AMP-forming)/AMP-acid ligase II